MYRIQKYFAEIKAMQIETRPTAASSYTRSLISRGCPQSLAVLAGQILARTDDAREYSSEEKALIKRAYAHLSR